MENFEFVSNPWQGNMLKSKILIISYSIIVAILLVILPFSLKNFEAFILILGFCIVFIVILICIIMDYLNNAKQVLTISNTEIKLENKQGIISKCKIDEITNIYVKLVRKIPLIIIEDRINQHRDSSFIINKKGFIIRFVKTKENVQIINKIWKHKILD